MAVALLHESAFDEAFRQNEMAEPDSHTVDRRSKVRLSAEDASWLRGARLKYGSDVRVIDVSTGGIQIEAEGAAPSPRANVVFELSGPKGMILAPARVVRSKVTRSGTYPKYQAAYEFKRPISIDTLAAVSQERATPQPAGSATSPAASPRVGWQRVVARSRGGQVLRGYTNDFHPSKTHFHLTVEDRSADPVLVTLKQLKAVFFVRDFTGDPNRVDRNEFGEAGHGRKVEVTFEDGEILLGTTLAYKGAGTGFFVHPADAGSNNMRVFVSPGATRNVRFV